VSLRRGILTGWKAESVDDARRVFAYTTRMLMGKILGDAVKFGEDDVRLDLSEKSYFSLSNGLCSMEGFKSTWNNSDLPRMIGRFAETAAPRIKYLEKHPEKTDAKIRM
jgi:hypothetical protein